MQASLSRSVIGPAGQAGGGSKQIADYSLLAADAHPVVEARRLSIRRRGRPSVCAPPGPTPGSSVTGPAACVSSRSRVRSCDASG
jgi:hypothetical protein